MREGTTAGGPPRLKKLGAALCLLLLLCAPGAWAQGPRTRSLLGVALGREAASWLDEIEGRVGRPVRAEFAELDPEGAAEDYTLGLSYFTDEGTPLVLVDESFRADRRKTEAVIGHELLHLRLRARGYPLFLFSPTVRTRKGPALDVEQSNVNDLVSLIEHRIFGAEMRRAGFDRLIDLTNGLEAARRKGRVEDGQAEMINYARATLEWPDPALVAEMARVYRANGWARSLDGGARLAGIIRASDINSPGGVAPVFLRCMAVLYGARFTVTPDRRFALSEIYPRMIIHSPRPARARRRP